MNDRRSALYRLCLVTDRDLAGDRRLVDIVDAAVAGGATMIQLREKRRSTRDFLADAQAVRERLHGTGVALVINDRVDVALAVAADAIHVGQDDMPVALVRRLVGPAMLIGLSVTDETQLREADPAADYFGLGPVYPQATKADAAAPLGLTGLARLRAMTPKPALAIGGLTAHNAADVMRVGADGLAVVSAIMASEDPRAATATLRRIIEANLPLTHD